MGSYNETCMLSNLPILEGEKVFVMVLQRTPNDCRQRFKYHAYGDWSPTPICFVADYSGYGSVEESTLDGGYKDIIPLFSEFLNFSRNIQKSDIPFWNFIDEVAKGNVSIKLEDNTTMPFSLAFISMEVLDQLLKVFKIGKDSSSTFMDLLMLFNKAIYNNAIGYKSGVVRMTDTFYGKLSNLFYDMNQTPIVETGSLTSFYGPMLASTFGDYDYDPLEHVCPEKITNIKTSCINNMLFIWIIQSFLLRTGKSFCVPSSSGQLLDFSATICLEKIKKTRIKSLKEAKNG